MTKLHGIFFTILFLLMASKSKGQSSPDLPIDVEDLITFLNDFLELENMDMFLVTSSNTTWKKNRHENQLLSAIFGKSHSIFQYDIDEMERLQAEFPIEPCPVYQSKVGSAINYTTFFMKEGQIYKRRPLFINGRHQRLLFVHLNSKELIPKMLQVLDDSILWCDEKRDLGFYHADTRLLFLVNDEEEMKIIYSHNNIQRHAKVSVMLYIPLNRKYIIYNYNFFKEESYPIFAWSKDHKLSHTKDIYNELKDFNSYEFKVGTNLYSHHMLATKLTKEEGYTKTNKYKDYWGYEYSIIEEASKQFNFNFKIINPADGQWGKINEKTGKWTGVVGDVIYNTIDIAISAIFQTFSRRMALDGTVHFSDDYLVIVAPNAKKFPQYLALINPFTPVVWLCMALFIFICSAAFYIIANLEQRITGFELKDWAVLKNAFWYVYGTYIGESITRDTKSKNAFAVRCVIAVWLYYSFILLSAYGGELKAFLTNPRYTSPIETVKGVVDSGLPWGMVLYGEDEERIMAETTDPYLKRLWEEKKGYEIYSSYRFKSSHGRKND
ncbi:uncharacterized protein [Lepeophtheirus salmonis]|uniref:uncharacterized protein isoform X1 n=2 Tax=Lepeophtheirus salmonis TaxID=72036 RepID=UPI001AE42906|nr:uncharacterized protein LOC121115652 isoform X1 [Lepeophtheirus salmonis]